MISVLRIRDYFWLWLGQTISQVGDGVRDWAMIFWIYNASGHNPVIQALSFIAVTAPNLLIGPVAGVWVDRWDRRKVMIYSDLIRGVLALAMAGAAILGYYYIAMVLVCLASCVGQFFNPARGAMIPRVVGQEHLVQANSLGQTTFSLLQLAGPGIGTGLFIALGAKACFVVDAASFFLSAVCIMRVRTPGTVPSKGSGSKFWAEFGEGIRFGWTSLPIRSMVIAFVALAAGAGAINSLGVILVRSILGLNEASMIAPSTAQPIASIVAAVAIGSAARKLKRAPVLVAVGALLGAIGIGLTGAALNIWWLVTGGVIVGFCNVLLNIGISTTMQSLVPDEMRGRIGSTIMALPTAATIASAAVAGVLAQTINPRLIIEVAASCLALAALVAYAGLRNVTIGEPPAATAVAD